MTTKTRSIRLETEMFDKIDEKCKGLGCNGNDFIKNAIIEKLNSSNSTTNLETHIQEGISDIKRPKAKIEVLLDSEIKNPENMIHFVYAGNGKYIDKNGSGATLENID